MARAQRDDAVIAHCRGHRRAGTDIPSDLLDQARQTRRRLMMTRLVMWRALALLLFATAAPSAPAAEVYQISTISSLLAGDYDGDTTVGELLQHGSFGLGTF